VNVSARESTATLRMLGGARGAWASTGEERGGAYCVATRTACYYLRRQPMRVERLKALWTRLVKERRVLRQCVGYVTQSLEHRELRALSANEFSLLLTVSKSQITICSDDHKTLPILARHSLFRSSSLLVTLTVIFSVQKPAYFPPLFA